MAAHGDAERGRSWEGEATVECGLGAKKLLTKSGEKDVETPAVLMHATDRSPGVCLWVLHGCGEVVADGIWGNRGVRGAAQRERLWRWARVG
jgi:hypothetical protein